MCAFFIRSFRHCGIAAFVERTGFAPFLLGLSSGWAFRNGKVCVGIRVFWEENIQVRVFSSISFGFRYVLILELKPTSAYSPHFELPGLIVDFDSALVWTVGLQSFLWFVNANFRCGRDVLFCECKVDMFQFIWMESPTNPLLKLCDIRAISDMAKSINPEIIVICDNTFMSPYFQVGSLFLKSQLSVVCTFVVSTFGRFTSLSGFTPLFCSVLRVLLSALLFSCS